jgi:hypothetical protein
MNRVKRGRSAPRPPSIRKVAVDWLVARVEALEDFLREDTLIRLIIDHSRQYKGKDTGSRGQAIYFDFCPLELEWFEDRLMKVLDGKKLVNTTLGVTCESLRIQQRIEKLEAALRFYADERNYERYWVDGITDSCKVEEDEGKKAREALNDL